jgi:hypothetical protein
LTKKLQETTGTDIFRFLKQKNCRTIALNHSTAWIQKTWSASPTIFEYPISYLNFQKEQRGKSKQEAPHIGILHQPMYSTTERAENIEDLH